MNSINEKKIEILVEKAENLISQGLNDNARKVLDQILEIDSSNEYALNGKIRTMQWAIDEGKIIKYI
ncbi:MAG: hypothetical protein NTV03_00305, partial [Candidatus Nomurabacteria bacterium]|nr:hypothetical protein [Candidatus Nomurabacteria bacterium]